MQGQLLWLAWAEILLIAILLYARRAAVRAVDLLRTKPGRTIGLGALFVLGLPIVIVLLALLVFSLPLAIIMAFGYALILYTAKLFPVLLIGGWLLRRKADKANSGFWGILAAGTVSLVAY